MALAITATLDPIRLAARLDVEGITTGATYTISRAAPSGNTAGVRGHTSQTLGSGQTSIIARDYELPFNVDLQYTVTIYDTGGGVVATASCPFRIDYDDCEAWLVDLARPTNSLPLVVESLRELAFDIANGVHRVLGRRAPVLTMLPAWTPSAELIVLTDTLDERDQVRALLGDGYPVLLRTTPDMGIGNMYLGISSFIEERFLTLGARPQRRFRAQVVQVERPDPAAYVPVPPNTYANVKATYATYAALKTGVITYDQLAYTYPAGPNIVPIVPWLPDDV